MNGVETCFKNINRCDQHLGGRGTTSPSSRAAGFSDRIGVTGWRYWGNDEWKEGDISLTCVEEDDGAGTSDSDENVNETTI